MANPDTPSGPGTFNSLGSVSVSAVKTELKEEDQEEEVSGILCATDILHI